MTLHRVSLETGGGLLATTRDKSCLSQLSLLIKQICPRTPQINNLGTSIPILLQSRTIRTIIRITNPLSPTNNTLPYTNASALPPKYQGRERGISWYQRNSRMRIRRRCGLGLLDGRTNRRRDSGRRRVHRDGLWRCLFGGDT